MYNISMVIILTLAFSMMEALLILLLIWRSISHLLRLKIDGLLLLVMCKNESTMDCNGLSTMCTFQR